MDEVKSYLQQVRHQEAAAEAIVDQINTLKQSKMSAAARIGDGMPHAHEPQDLSGYAAKLDELERRLSAYLDEMAARKLRVVEAIEEMTDPQEQAVLIRYYLGGETWDQVAEDLHYTTRQIINIHGQALQHIRFH